MAGDGNPERPKSNSPVQKSPPSLTSGLCNDDTTTALGPVCHACDSLLMHPIMPREKQPEVWTLERASMICLPFGIDGP